MRRNSSAAAVAVAVIAFAALAVSALLVWRALPPATDSRVVVSESGTRMPVALPARGARRRTVETPRFPNLRDAQVDVEVATYGRLPSQTVVLELEGADGERLRSCRIAPSEYTDNGTVACPVDRPDRVRRVRVAVGGSAPFAVYAVSEGGKLVTGSLVQRHRYSGLGARLAALRERVGVTRPALASPIVLLVCLTASIALLGTGLLLAAGRARAHG